MLKPEECAPHPVLRAAWDGVCQAPALQASATVGVLAGSIERPLRKTYQARRA